MRRASGVASDFCEVIHICCDADGALEGHPGQLNSGMRQWTLQGHLPKAQRRLVDKTGVASDFGEVNGQLNFWHAPVDIAGPLAQGSVASC